MSLIPGIKQISQVGNDMYFQGIVPVGISTTEVGYIADPADTRLLAGRDPVLEEVSVGMSGVETEQKYATGAQPLTVTDAMNGNLTYCNVQFSPKQDFNGYSAPWPAGGGVNKFNKDGTDTANGYVADRYIISIGLLIEPTTGTWFVSEYIPVKSNTTYTISGLASTDSNAPSIFFYKSDKGELNGVSYNNRSSFSVTTPSDCAYVRLSIGPTDAIAGTVQFEEGSTASAYSPYSNICPITGTTNVNVYVAPAYDPSVAPETTVSLGAERFGGNANLVSGDGIEEWNTITLNGFENWGGSGTHGMWTQVNAVKRSTDYSAMIVCETLPTYDRFDANAFSNAEYGITAWVGNPSQYPNQNWIYLAAAGINNVTDLKVWLAQNPVRVVFVKNTPTTFTFSGANSITLEEGTNTIWTDTNGTDISVTYVTKK